MSEISNRFFITALEDGTTLHGNLTADRSLTQAWNGTNAVSDWSQSTEQPTIYLTLLDGETLVSPNSGYTWYHDNVAIQFNSSGVSSDGLFQKTTKSVTYGGVTLDMPALKIIGNLANSNNVDSDTISISGTYSLKDNATVGFSASAQVRITQITSNGYLGSIIFPNGLSDITADNSSVQMYGVLYGDTGTAMSNITTKWYLNSSTTATDGATITDKSGTQHDNGYTVTEAQVVDHAVVRCEFCDASGSVLYTAYVGIDDLTDPEFMYIQNNGANGNAASLRKGESAKLTIWVGKEGDATVDENFQTFKVKVIKGDGTVSTAALDGFNDVESTSTGLRSIGLTDKKATLTIPYETVVSLGKNMTGLVYAYSS